MTIYANARSDTPLNKQSERLVFAYKVASILIVLMSGSWCIFFAIKGWGLLAVAEAILGVVGGVSWALLRAGRLRAALMISEIAFLAFAVGFCLIFDVPTLEYPRFHTFFCWCWQC